MFKFEKAVGRHLTVHRMRHVKTGGIKVFWEHIHVMTHLGPYESYREHMMKRWLKRE